MHHIPNKILFAMVNKIIFDYIVHEINWLYFDPLASHNSILHNIINAEKSIHKDVQSNVIYSHKNENILFLTTKEELNKIW